MTKRSGKSKKIARDHTDRGKKSACQLIQAHAAEEGGSHKLLRCFYFRFRAGQDPAANHTGAQKATVLFSIILGKLFICAAYTNPRCASCLSSQLPSLPAPLTAFTRNRVAGHQSSSAR